MVALLKLKYQKICGSVLMPVNTMLLSLGITSLRYFKASEARNLTEFKDISLHSKLHKNKFLAGFPKSSFPALRNEDFITCKILVPNLTGFKTCQVSTFVFYLILIPRVH